MTDAFDINVGGIGEDNDWRFPGTVGETFEEPSNVAYDTVISNEDLHMASDPQTNPIIAQILRWASNIEQDTNVEAGTMNNYSKNIFACTDDDIYAASEGSPEDIEMNSCASIPDASEVDTASFGPAIPPFQPGLGTLGRATWEEIEDYGDEDYEETKERRKKIILTALQGDKQWNLKSDPQADALSILRVSKQLYSEVSGDFYRDRTLSICFNNNKHSLLLQRVNDRHTEFYVNIDGVCVERDFVNLDFAMFASLRLEIELPSNKRSLDKFFDLRDHIGNLSDIIGKWQSRTYRCRLRRWCPRIDVDIRLHRSTQLCSLDDYDQPELEISLNHIRRLLSPLTLINKVEDVTIKVHFRLRYGKQFSKPSHPG
ncbi:MAG: hypothetical protein Q9213_002500 [Squamulea squamosa]